MLEKTKAVSAFDTIRDAIAIADILTFHSIQHKVNSNEIGRCRCPLCKADDATAFFFDKNSFHCFICESRGGVIELEMFLACVNTPKQAAMALARRHDIKVSWPHDHRDKRMGLVHISQLLPPMLQSSKLCRKAWDRQIGNLKTVRDTKAKALTELRARWQGTAMSEHEKAIERSLLDEINALDERLAAMWVESNTAVASLRIQERGGSNE